MSKTLLINLKRFGDIYASAHLITSMQKAMPSEQFSLLVFDESKKATTNLKGISHIYSIDRQKLLRVSSQPIYPTALALELFKETIDTILSQGFNKVINYSNDLLSTLITSYLKDKNPAIQVIGIYQDKEGRVIPSNFWATVFNDLLPSIEQSPIHFNECYHRMVGVPFVHDEIKVSIKESYNTQARNYFSQIRSTLQADEMTVQLIGIQLKSSDPKKDFSKETVMQLIEKILDNPHLYPILLIAPFDNEREYAEYFNKMFNQSLVVVEADFEALSATLTHLDAVITPDTVTKHLANLTSTPVVEISLGSAPAARQGSIGVGDIILTPHIPCYPCSAKKDCRITPRHVCHKLVTASDIYQALLFRIGHRDQFEGGTGGSHPLYVTYNSTLGYHELKGTDPKTLFAKSFIYKLAGITSDYLGTLPHKTAEDERDTIANAMRCTQVALKEVSSIAITGKPTQLFAKSLQEIMSICDQNSATAIATKIARAKIENMRSQNIVQNAKDAETILLELRNNLHLLSELLLQRTVPRATL